MRPTPLRSAMLFYPLSHPYPSFYCVCSAAYSVAVRKAPRQLMTLLNTAMASNAGGGGSWGGGSLRSSGDPAVAPPIFHSHAPSPAHPAAAARGEILGSDGLGIGRGSRIIPLGGRGGSGVSRDLSSNTAEVFSTLCGTCMPTFLIWTLPFTNLDSVSFLAGALPP